MPSCADIVDHLCSAFLRMKRGPTRHHFSSILALGQIRAHSQLDLSLALYPCSPQAHCDVVPSRGPSRKELSSRVETGTSCFLWIGTIPKDPRVDIWDPDQVILIPSPRVPNWRGSQVLWYPARFIERHEDREGEKYEYEFQRLECNDGTTYNSATSDLPVLMQRTFHRTRKFCQEVDEVHLTEKKNNVDRENSHAALLKILASFDHSHPVIENFNTHFKGKKKIDRSRHADKWMHKCGLVSNPELEAVLEPALGQIMSHSDLVHLQHDEKSERVLGVSALLQMLAVKRQLEEPLNLNGELLADLLDERVVHCPNDGDAAIEAMFVFSGGGPSVANRMLTFSSEHVIYEEEFAHPRSAAWIKLDPYPLIRF
ncbi:hypothetical protein B0H13DRAFT_2330265 [Mycena leptocephala]|nr:hypothetical protein B0H13DRAFT_2330265 [Mycena leptocephala]